MTDKLTATVTFLGADAAGHGPRMRVRGEGKTRTYPYSHAARDPYGDAAQAFFAAILSTRGENTSKGNVVEGGAARNFSGVRYTWSV